MTLFGAMEMGGTKTVCAVVTADGELLAKIRFPTVDPRPTFKRAVEFFRSQSEQNRSVGAIGVGCFGPIERNPLSANYGLIGNTSKKHWARVSVLKEVARYIDVPAFIDTDVNCALLAEARWGAGRGCDNVVYMTIGTGIGVGIMSGGKLVNGGSHPEFGHTLIPAQENDRDFEGCCPHHGARCAEGLAAGPAISKRWGTDAEHLSDDHPAWQLEAEYLAVICTNIFLTVAPQRIILGGGVMGREHLFGLVRAELRKCLGGYIDLQNWNEALDDLVVPVGLDNDAGVLGASIIAEQVV